MSGKLVWNPIKKQYEPKGKPEIIKSDPDSLDILSQEDKSGDEGDYKYTTEDLDRELGRYTGEQEPLNAKKRRMPESIDDTKDKIIYLNKELTMQKKALTLLVNHNEKLKEILKDLY